MINQAKEAAGKAAADLIEEGMRVGLGTGSTVRYFLEFLGKRCREGLSITAVGSSLETERIAKEQGIPLGDLSKLEELDIVVDGADEIDSEKRMIKGGGGALLREKILAKMGHKRVIIVDPSKVVAKLGNCKIPLEIIPFAHQATIFHLKQMGYQGSLRANAGKPFITDNGNYLWDIAPSTPISDPALMDLSLRTIPGILETGLFHGLADQMIVGHEDGKVEFK